MMSNNLLVSVIIPNYNHALFLEERIQSVLNQTYQKFEVIILDDKSTDDSIDIINKYRDHPRVSHVVVNEKNSGSPFKQWFLGMSLAKGEWIWIAESDDSCDKCLLDNLVDILSGNEVISFCRSNRIDSEGKTLPFGYQDVLQNDLCLNGKLFIQEYLGKKCVICNASSAIFKREAALEIPKDFQNYEACGDWLFWIYMALQGDVAFVNKPLNYFRSHGDNTTNKGITLGISQREKKQIVDFLYRNSYITLNSYKAIRKREIKKIYFGTELCDSTIKRNLLENWNLTKMEAVVLQIKKLYQSLVKGKKQ